MSDSWQECTTLLSVEPCVDPGMPAGNVLEPERNGALPWMDALLVARRR